MFHLASRGKTASIWLLAGSLAALSGRSGRADLITFDDLSNLPARTSSSSFSAANGGSSTLDGVTFPSTFAISGDQNTVTPSAGPFLIPHSGHYAGYGFENTTIATSLILQSVYLGSTSLQSAGDGVTALSIEALRIGNQVLGSVSITGLTVTPRFVDTSVFSALSGISGYEFRVDTSGANNPRFSVDDLRLSAVPEPSSMIIAAVGALGFFGIGMVTRKSR